MKERKKATKVTKIESGKECAALEKKNGTPKILFTKYISPIERVRARKRTKRKERKERECARERRKAEKRTEKKRVKVVVVKKGRVLASALSVRGVSVRENDRNGAPCTLFRNIGISLFWKRSNKRSNACKYVTTKLRSSCCCCCCSRSSPFFFFCSFGVYIFPHLSGS